MHLLINPETRTRDEIATYRFDDLDIMRVFVEEVVQHGQSSRYPFYRHVSIYITV